MFSILFPQKTRNFRQKCSRVSRASLRKPSRCAGNGVRCLTSHHRSPETWWLPATESHRLPQLLWAGFPEWLGRWFWPGVPCEVGEGVSRGRGDAKAGGGWRAASRATHSVGMWAAGLGLGSSPHGPLLRAAPVSSHPTAVPSPHERPEGGSRARRPAALPRACGARPDGPRLGPDPRPRDSTRTGFTPAVLSVTARRSPKSGHGESWGPHKCDRQHAPEQPMTRGEKSRGQWKIARNEQNGAPPAARPQQSPADGEPAAVSSWIKKLRCQLVNLNFHAKTPAKRERGSPAARGGDDRQWKFTTERKVGSLEG